jgi:hypothetical protein
MRKCSVATEVSLAARAFPLAVTLLLQAFTGSLPLAAARPATDAPPVTYATVTEAAVVRAQHAVDRIKALVEVGALPKKRLEQAETSLADAEDEAILVRTLHGSSRIEDLSLEDSKLMVEAAERRVVRQQTFVDERKKLVDEGILAPAEIETERQELGMRRGTLDLARNRARLLVQLADMAKAEQELERAKQADLATPKGGGGMVRFDGNGIFSPDDLKTVSAEYEKRFHEALPVSALGQTLMHQSLGFDHRNRVDVALSPDQKEGLWLRSFLERLHIPYLAFREAVPGAATGAHIHIGPASTRLKMATL